MKFVTVLMQPAKRTAYAGGSDRVFAPVERELVFDIVSSQLVAILSIAEISTTCISSLLLRYLLPHPD